MTRQWRDPLAATVRPRRTPYQRRPDGQPAPRRTTDPALGWEHQQQRQRLREAHVDGTPCPCLALNDCGPACPCRPAGRGLPMYRDPKRNVDGRMIEADHSRARSRGGQIADRLILSVCNRSRGDGQRLRPAPAQGERLVVVLCGPPGAGKTTAAQLGAAMLNLQVYDRDDPQWSSESQFSAALARLASNPTARAVVIRAGATSSARQRAVRTTAATHCYLLTESRQELGRRVAHRGRADMRQGLASIDDWFTRFDRDDQVQNFPGWDSWAGGSAHVTPQARSVAVASTEW